MKITFITNFMTQHQLPFCQAMYELLGDDFCFIETNKMDEERVKMGWDNEFDEYPFISEYQKGPSDEIILNSDIVLCGGTHVWYIQERLKTDKITFRYFERLYKKGRIHAFSPRGYIKKLKEHTSQKDKNVFLLCAGAYVPADFNMFKAYPDKMFKWGYFPKRCGLDIEEILNNKSESTEILWTGRMLDWKHPEDVVILAAYLKLQGYDFHVTMIGEGEQRENVEALIEANGVEDCVTVLDFVKPDVVRSYMQKANIYLMTSDYQEGWGAVVNEAMDSGCAVVASVGAGASPYLIKHKDNGLLYNTGDTYDMIIQVKWLIYRKDEAKRLGRNAYNTINGEWSEKEAATRFVELSKSLLTDNKKYFYDNGPLSKAEIVAPKLGYEKFVGYGR